MMLPTFLRFPRLTTLLKAMGWLAASGLMFVMGEALVRARLDGPHASGPTRYYAWPVVLQPGTRVAPHNVEATLRRLGYVQARGRRVRIGEYRWGQFGGVIGRRSFRVGGQVDPGGITQVRLGPDWQVEALVDGDGDWLEQASLEPEPIFSGADDDEVRVVVELDDMPRHLVSAVLAVEDRRFYDHWGVDLRRVAGAAVANLRARRVVQGGSTLTQQLAKNRFLSSRRTPIRKLRELAMALVLEARHTKDEILEAYINEIYLGQSGGMGLRGCAAWAARPGPISARRPGGWMPARRP